MPDWSFTGRIACAGALIDDVENELNLAQDLTVSLDVLSALHDAKIALWRAEEALERAADCFADAKLAAGGTSQVVEPGEASAPDCSTTKDS